MKTITRVLTSLTWIDAILWSQMVLTIVIFTACTQPPLPPTYQREDKPIQIYSVVENDLSVSNLNAMADEAKGI